MIQRLNARVADLERRLGLNSQNSSRPPSSDPPGAPGPAKAKPSGRKPGGQPGHRGHRRRLLPPDQLDGVEHHWPTRCDNAKCRARFPIGRGRKDAAPPRRHQVTEIPEVKPTTIEHQQHSVCCADCGVVTTAPLPADVPRGAFGPMLMAMVAILTGCYRMSKRNVVGAMKDLFGVEMSLGSVTPCEQAISASLEAPVVEAHEYMQNQRVAHADETGWREGRRRAWMWVAATTFVTVFRICAQRGKKAAQALLGNFQGVLVTDRWDAYLWYKGLRQICWAHLKRDFRAMSERPGAAGQIGAALSGNTKLMFKWWHRVRDGTMTRQQFHKRMRPVRLDFERLLKLGERGRTSISGSCGEMFSLFGSFFTFIDVEGVEPTNNHAERQIRAAVIWRKTSFGTHSAAGSRFVERIMTVRSTLRQQNRSVVAFVVHAHQAALRGEAAGSLVPEAATMPIVAAA